MSNDNPLIDLEHAVDRHETAINEDAKDIARIKAQIAIIAEALEKLEFCCLTGLRHTEAGDKARKRIPELVAELKSPSSQ